MPTTSTTAGDASNGLIHTAGDDGTYTIKTGAAGSKVNALSFAADGTPTFLKSGMVLGTSQATTSGTSIDFTGIPSWVKKVTVTLNGVSTNGSDAYLLQLGDSGGIETSGYGGAIARIVDAANPTTSRHNLTAGFIVCFNTVASDVVHATIIFTLSNPATNTWSCLINSSRDDAAVAWTGSGSKFLSPGPLDRIRLATSGGVNTFDAGSVNILYEG